MMFSGRKKQKGQEKQDIFNLFPDREIPDRGIFRCWLQNATEIGEKKSSKKVEK